MSENEKKLEQFKSYTRDNGNIFGYVIKLESQLAILREALEQIKLFTDSDNRLTFAGEIASDALKKCFGDKNE